MNEVPRLHRRGTRDGSDPRRSFGKGYRKGHRLGFCLLIATDNGYYDGDHIPCRHRKADRLTTGREVGNLGGGQIIDADIVDGIGRGDRKSVV